MDLVFENLSAYHARSLKKWYQLHNELIVVFLSVIVFLLSQSEAKI